MNGSITRYGKLKWFNDKKGYGFITDEKSGKDVFVHITQFQKAGITDMNEGQNMSYELYNDKGRIAAGHLILLAKENDNIKNVINA